MSHPHADQPSGPSDPYRDPHAAQARQPARNGQLPSYKLILQADAGDDMMHIIRTIMELTRFCVAEATHKMWQAHHAGRSQLLVTYKERAELYVEQFAQRGLTVTIEE